MLATIYAKNPKRFKKTDENVKKILNNNVAWPKNYHLGKYQIKDTTPK